MHTTKRAAGLAICALIGSIVFFQVAARADDLPQAPGSGSRQSADRGAPGEDPAITARATEWFHRLQAGDIDRLQLSDGIKEKMTENRVKLMRERLSPYGEPSSFVFEKRAQGRDGIVYGYRVATARGELQYEIGIGWDGTIMSLMVEPLG